MPCPPNQPKSFCAPCAAIRSPRTRRATRIPRLSTVTSAAMGFIDASNIRYVAPEKRRQYDESAVCPYLGERVQKRLDGVRRQAVEPLACKREQLRRGGIQQLPAARRYV